MCLQRAPREEILMSPEEVPVLPGVLPVPKHFQVIRGELFLLMEIRNSQLTRLPENRVRIRLKQNTFVQIPPLQGPVQIQDLNIIVLTGHIHLVIIIQG